VKTQAELIDDMRQNIFDLLDRMTRKKQELTEKFVVINTNYYHFLLHGMIKLKLFISVSLA